MHHKYVNVYLSIPIFHKYFQKEEDKIHLAGKINLEIIMTGTINFLVGQSNFILIVIIFFMVNQIFLSVFYEMSNKIKN